MPIYEYACKACGHDFDVLQKVSDGALRKCPRCSALKLQRLVSAPQFRLKGTGWYETDFKKDGRKRLAEAGEGKAAADKDGGDKGTAGNTGADQKADAGKAEAGKKNDAGKQGGTDQKPATAEKSSSASPAPTG